jgi:propanediol dehydratase large subunit
MAERNEEQRRSKRFAKLAERPVNRETFIHELPDLGLVIMNSPFDPEPSVVVENGAVVGMDGREFGDFDFVDRYIAKYAIDVDRAVEVMARDSGDIARLFVDVNVPRDEVCRVLSACTPAKIVDVMSRLNVVEMMMAMQKMRQRRTPANQAHVTNWKENPALLAADAAEAALRGFDEEETTVRVARNAPLNALALLVGSQTGRGGVLTQCSVEEALNLRLALKGLTSYAETLSVYGTVASFVDGDDTPWSKGLLASAYASRGVKCRFTSGTGSEALMGYSQGRSMLYLETRCLMMVKGAGSQGVQNGSISCIALVESLPDGVRGVMAENLTAAALGLEVASGHDALASHSDIRKTAKLMLSFLPGTDFITSGYSAIPKRDNLFGGGNFDAEDLDDWLVLQRDMKVDAGLVPVAEADVITLREKAARALRAVYAELGFPPITEAEIEAAATAHGSDDMEDRDLVADLAAADAFLDGPLSAIDVVRALDANGFEDVAGRVLEMQRQRIIGDYLQTSAILDENFKVLSAINDPNDYAGPGTGYRLEGQRWDKLKNLPQAVDAQTLVPRQAGDPGLKLAERGPAAARCGEEIVIALGPAFGVAVNATLSDLSHASVLQALMAGVAEEGLKARVVRVYETADCAAIGHLGARLSGSGIAIGIQSKGTTVIHRKDLEPLNNLELFSQAPNLTLESYRAIGRNAALHAKGRPPRPVAVKIDNTARLRLIVHTTLLHHREIEQIRQDGGVVDLEVTFP